jgi:hypothetical protein
MGATTFHTGPWKADTIGQAYQLAHDAADYEYGHRGYTGEINVKSGYWETTLPTGVAPETFFEYLGQISYGEEFVLGPRPTLETLPEWATKWGHAEEHLTRDIKRWDDFKTIITVADKAQLKRAAEVYDDKWGPAVAVYTSEGWHFGGYASC